MKPGSTIIRDASIAVASALISGRTAMIFLSSIRTSAFSKSPTAGSKLSTTPPLSRVRTGPRWANAGRAMPATAVAASVAGADLIRARRLTFTDRDRGNLVPLPVLSIMYSSDPVTDPTGALQTCRKRRSATSADHAHRIPRRNDLADTAVHLTVRFAKRCSSVARDAGRWPGGYF